MRISLEKINIWLKKGYGNFAQKRKLIGKGLNQLIISRRQKTSRWFEVNHHHLVDLFMLVILVLSLSIIGVFLTPVIFEFNSISIVAKISVSENILQGTLALGAIALTVLGFAYFGEPFFQPWTSCTFPHITLK
jgi:hypothetical protein